MFDSLTGTSTPRLPADGIATAAVSSKKLARWLAVLLLVFVISLLGPTPTIGQTTDEPSTSSTPDQGSPEKKSPKQQIESELRRIGKQYKHPSLFAGYQTLGQPFVGAALGRRKKGAAARVTIDDKVHIGSCTKAMTATMIARLIERGPLKHGRLAWEMTIAEGLPELSKAIDPIFAKVTMRQLLMHRGGCPANTAWGAAGDKKSIVETRRSLISIALKSEQPNKPGEFLYSNVGYLVAGAIAERVTGKPWETLMQEEIFEPLGITSAGFGPPDVDQDLKQPWGHTSVASLQIPRHLDNPAALGPAGTVHISLEDWAKFCLSHALTDQEAENDKQEASPEFANKLRLLTQESLDFLHSPPKDPVGVGGDDYALGWGVAKRDWGGTVFTHSGSNTIWTAIVWISPKNKSVYLVATNIANEQSGIGLDKIFATLIRLEKEARE